MDQFTRRIIGFGTQNGIVNGMVMYLVTVYVIQGTFNNFDDVPLLTPFRSKADKNDLISSAEARRTTFGSRWFSEPNDIVVYGFPNGGEIWVIRTIRKQIAVTDDDLFSTAKSLIRSKFLIRFPISRHTEPLLRLILAVCTPPTRFTDDPADAQ
jgi:hypothetical protein